MIELARADRKAAVLEIWDKVKNEVHWVSPGYADVLESGTPLPAQHCRPPNHWGTYMESWDGGDEWLVTAREQIGIVVSVQFTKRQPA